VRAAQEIVVREKCHAAFITDGDADRIGAAAEDGSYVDSHKIFSILLQWVLKYHKDWRGDVVRAFNTTRMLDRIAARHGRKLLECGIGFKYICDLMLERQILIGGEESGGIGFQRHLPERDGILNALLLANVMADEGKSLGQLVAALQSEYGPHFYARRDLRIPNDIKEAAIARAAAADTTSLGRYKILKKENLDGIKFFLDAPIQDRGAEAWILLRSSGTEPLMRIYAEASSPELVQEMLEEAVAFVDNKVPAATH
jgi:phosphomannomutase